MLGLSRPWITRWARSRKDQRKQPSTCKRPPNAATNASCAASGATGHERAPNDGKLDKADETNSLHPLPHGYQQEATSTIPQQPGHPQATPRQPPLNDSKISTACTKNACVTWHPPPSPPLHPEALACPIPNTLSTNEPNTSSSTCNTVHVGNRLSCNLMFWRQIGASNFVLSVVEHGYSLPLVHFPDRLFFRNSPSALKHYAFVPSAICQLVTSGVVEETTADALPLFSSLGAVPKKSGKLRLILDRRYLNEHLHTEKFTFEDLRIIPSIFRLDDLLFTFDLQDAYDHIPIAMHLRPYLGFAWSINGMQKFFQFKVLPFGISTAPYVFTKITKPLAKHWRSQGIRMFWYLDDGTGGDQPYEKAARHSRIIRDDILRSGFRLNEAKSDFSPRRQAKVLGVVIDAKQNLMTAVRSALLLVKQKQNTKNQQMKTVTYTHGVLINNTSLTPTLH